MLLKILSGISLIFNSSLQRQFSVHFHYSFVWLLHSNIEKLQPIHRLVVRGSDSYCLERFRNVSFKLKRVRNR